jgi:beta-lactam-binding protein with PASTA domain
MKRRLILLVTTCHVLVGCGPGVHRVPNVTGERLDVAETILDDKGLGYDTVGGVVILRSHWRVVRQIPKAGTRARHVHLVVVHDEADDDDWDP